MHEVRVGIIGAGFIAQQSHIPSYLNSPSTTIIGIADPDTRKLDEVKNLFGVQETFSDYKDLFKEPMDAISICTPPKYHAEITIEAANRGLHILCEKPIALTLEEADKMIEACKKNNVQLMVGFNYRFIKNHEKAKRMMEEGRIGKPFFIQGQFASTGPYGDFERTRNSFYFDPIGGGGVLLDSGSHLFDLLRWFCGEPKSVSAKIGTYGKDIKVEDVATATLDFENGCIGVLTCMWTQIESWSVMGSEGFIKIVGSEGKIISQLFGPSLKYFSKRSKICKIRGEIELTPRGFDPSIPTRALQKSWFDEINAFVEAIKSGKNVPVTGEDGKKALGLVLKAYESARKV